MGLWGRLFGKRPYGPHGFMKVVELELLGRGLEHELGDGWVDIVLGGKKQRFGLTNVAQLCAQSRPAGWRGILQSHFDNAFRGETEAADVDRRSATLDGVRELLRVRFYGAADLAQIGTPPAREVADDLRLVAVFDLPSTVMVVPRETLDRWARPIDDVLEAGLANVRAEGKLQSEKVEGVIGLAGDGFTAASHALFLEDYADLDPERGAVVIVPNRHTVVFHPLHKTADAVPAVNVLIQMAHKMYQAGPGSISPSLYWRRGARWMRLPATVKDRTVQFVPPQEFVDLLNGLP